MAKLVVLNEYDRCIKCRGCVVGCQRNFVNSSLGKELVGNTGAGVGKISTDDPTVVKPQLGFDYPPFMKHNCWHCASPPCAGRCPRKAISKKGDGSVVVDFSLCDPTICNQECAKDCGHGGYPKIGTGNGVDLKAYKCDLCYGRRLALLVNNGGVVAGNRDVIDSKTFGSFRTEAKAKIGGTDLTAITTYQVSACVHGCPTGALKLGYYSDVDAYIASQGYNYKHGLPNDSWKWAGKLMSGVPSSDPLLDDHLVPLTHQMVDGKLVPIGLLIGGLYMLYRRRREVEEVGQR